MDLQKQAKHTVFLFWPSWIFGLLFLVIFKSKVLSQYHVIISDCLADFPSLWMFCFQQGKDDGEMITFSTSPSPPSSGYLFLGLLAYVLPPAMFFSMSTGIWNCLLISPVGFSFLFLAADYWLLMGKNPHQKTHVLNECSPVIWNISFAFFMLATFPQVFWKIRQISLCKTASPGWLSILLSLSAAHIVINGLLAAVAYGLRVELQTAELYPAPCTRQQPHVWCQKSDCAVWGGVIHLELILHSCLSV